MGYYLDLVGELIGHPRVALRTITRGEQWGIAAVFWIFTVLIMSLSSFIEGVGVFLGFLICLLVSLGALLLHSSMVHYIAGLMGGRGSARGITAGFMTTIFPFAFTVFASLSETVGIPAVPGIIGVASLIWVTVLDIIAVSENYGFTTGKAVLVILIPVIAAAAFALALLGLGTAIGVSAIMSGI